MTTFPSDSGENLSSPNQPSPRTEHSPRVDATTVLINLVAAGYHPAALIGNWFGAEAVIAPNIEVAPMAAKDLFPTNNQSGSQEAPDTAPATSSSGTTDHTQPWFFGVRPYQGVSFGGFSNSVLLLRDGIWHAKNVSDEVYDIAMRPAADISPVTIQWDDGDSHRHRMAVQSCKDAIRAGEVYQACISTRFIGTASLESTAGAPHQGSAENADNTAPADSSCVTLHTAAHWFAAKVNQHHPARAAFIPGSEAHRLACVASISPEEFLIRHGESVSESPIKGTLPLDAPAEALLASEKDVAENIMIVDLVRHDLGQIAVTGGVRVTDLLSVRPAPGVWHLFSTVEATIPAELPHAEVIEACFPPASVTGTPKLRAQTLIDEWEPVSRGIHCGCIGASTSDRLELNVAIRTVEFYETNTPGQVRAELGVGGGITIGSDATAEWAEVCAKAAPLR